MSRINNSSRQYVVGLVLGVLLFAEHASSPAIPTTSPPRERLSINDDWRFTKGDPPGNTVSLLYDIRPPWPRPPGAGRQTVTNQAEAQAALTNQATPAPALLKQWILPTGNDFIIDP